MIVKLFEIRDRATFIPVLAVRLDYKTEAERFLLRRAGYNPIQIQPSYEGEPYVLLSKLDGVRATYDPYAWDSGTMCEAHTYILANWRELETGAVIDVEFIRGDTTEPKKSEAERG